MPTALNTAKKLHGDQTRCEKISYQSITHPALAIIIGDMNADM